MYSHTTVGTNDLAKAEKFYNAVMGALGHAALYRTERSIGYGEVTGEKLFIVPPFDGKEARAGNGVHIAFKVESRVKVDAFYAAAMANGGTDEGPPGLRRCAPDAHRSPCPNGGTDEGPPGLRPHYHPHYYAAYVRDPDGNKLQAVCHRKAG